MLKNYHPFRFYTGVAAIFFLLGLLVGIPVVVEFFKTAYITKVPSAVLATGLMIIAVLTEQCGIILETVVRVNRENYELNLLRYTQIEELKKRKDNE